MSFVVLIGFSVLLGVFQGCFLSSGDLNRIRYKLLCFDGYIGVLKGSVMSFVVLIGSSVSYWGFSRSVFLVLVM